MRGVFKKQNVFRMHMFLHIHLANSQSKPLTVVPECCLVLKACHPSGTVHLQSLSSKSFILPSVFNRAGGWCIQCTVFCFHLCVQEHLYCRLSNGVWLQKPKKEISRENYFDVQFVNIAEYFWYKILVLDTDFGEERHMY